MRCLQYIRIHCALVSAVISIIIFSIICFSRCFLSEIHWVLVSEIHSVHRKWKLRGLWGEGEGGGSVQHKIVSDA